MDIKLVVAEGKLAGQEIPVTKDDFFIGKAKQCHLRPGGSTVGDKHCVIHKREGSASVEDFGTPAGTLVNGERIAGEQPLKNGDKLQVGSLVFDVQLTVEVSGKKKPKVKSISEAASRVSQKAQAAKEEDLDIFAIFDEEIPGEEDLPSFITRKRDEEGTGAAHAGDDSDLEKEKKMQESTRNAAADTIKAILNQTRR